MIVTRKIELYVDADPAGKDEIFRWLRDLQRQNWLLANQAMSLLWFYHYLENNLMTLDQQQLHALDELLFHTQDQTASKKYTLQRKKLLHQARKQAQDLLRERFEVTYAALVRRALAAQSRQPGGMYDRKGGSYLLDGMFNRVSQDFSNDLTEVLQGKKSIRRYRQGLPLYFQKRAIKSFEAGESQGEYYLHWMGIRFGLVFGRDKNHRSHDIQQIIDGAYGYGDSALQLKDKKLYLLLSLKLPGKETAMDPSRCMEVDAGVLVPVECRYGSKKQRFGNADDLLRFRLQKQARYRAVQKALTLTGGGNGRKKKLAKLQDLSNLEHNFINTYNHKLSTSIIKYAIKHRAAKMVVNELALPEQPNQKNQAVFQARNWAGSALSTMIAYKAKMHGIEVLIQKAEQPLLVD
ncbi:MAG: hypothetical protein RIG62_14970 [Cyclobacteriaceae bacterium]